MTTSRADDAREDLEDGMPAITADTLTLPRITAAGLGDTERPVKQINTGPKGVEGEGFPVTRAFAGVPMADLDPFVHMDQMGEVDYAPLEPKGTPWHPHRGFETVTYMIDGTFQHQDSNGGGGVINDGATQWMTAGAGILHIETPPEDLVISGGRFHGTQLWVNLPAKDKFLPPRYQAIEGAETALLTSADAGALVRVIAGELDGHQGPGSTHTPITLAHLTLQLGAQISLPWNTQYNALVYVLSGNGSVGAEQRPIKGGQLAVMGAGDRITIAASTSQDSNKPVLEVYLLGGQPIGEPVAQYGPFVMNTKAELEQAIEDYQAGRLGIIPPHALQPYRG
ncbi:MAG TPA: pirin family protein [Jatrophihabitans sp.]